MSTCSLSGNILSGSSLVIKPSGSNGITFKTISGPVDYISSSNNLIIDTGGTISLSDAGSTYGSFSSNGGNIVINSGGSNINFSTYGYVTNNNGFTISPFPSLSLNLNSNYAGGQINLQNGLGNTYGTISNDNGLHIQNKSSYIVIDSNSNPIYMYTGTNTNNTNPNNGLILQTLQTGSAVVYGSFYNETNSYSITGPNNLTIVSGNNGSNLGSIKFFGAGTTSGETIAVVVGNGYLATANLSLYYDNNVNNNSAIINTPNQLTLQTNNSIYLNAGSDINGTSTNNTIYLQNNGATYGYFNSTNGFTVSSSTYLTLSASSLVIKPSGSNGITFKTSSGPVDYISSSNNLIIDSDATISLSGAGSTYGSFNNQNGFTISSSTYLTLSASTSNTSGYNQSFYFYSNGNGYNGPFLSISEDASYDVGIFTIANNGNNLSPNLNISTVGSINLNVHSDNNPNKSFTINLRDAGSTYGSFNNQNGFTISSQSGNLNLSSPSRVTTNYNGATLGSSDIINGNSLQNILGGVNSSRLGSLSGYNYMTSRYVSNTTGYSLINNAGNGIVYGNIIYFTNIYNAIGGCFLVTTIYSSFLNDGEVGVSLVIGTNNVYQQRNLYSPGYISIGVAGTNLGNGIIPISGNGLFFYSGSLSQNTVISFTTMQIA